MASSNVRTVPNTPSLSPTMFHMTQMPGSVTRSGKIRRNLDPQFASNSVQISPLNGIGNLMIYMGGPDITDPEDLFFFVDGGDIKKMPDFINCTRPMTHVQRTKVVTIEGNESGMSVTAMVFCRMEEGMSEEFAYANKKKIGELFSLCYQLRANTKDAYYECVSRFPEAMRCDYTYPDFGKGQGIAAIDWNDSASQSLLLEHTPNPSAANLLRSKGLRVGLFSQTQSQGFLQKQVSSQSQTLPGSFSKAKSSSKSPVETQSEDKENSNAGCSRTDGKGKKSQETRKANTQQQGSGKIPSARRNLPSTPKAKEKQDETNEAPNRSRGQGNGNFEKSKGARKEYTNADNSQKSRKDSEASNDSIEEESQEVIKEKKAKKRKAMAPEFSDDEDFVDATQEKEGKKKENKRGIKKTRCTPLCNCWNMSEEQLFENFGEKISEAERDHRTLIHQHKTITSMRNKMKAISREMQAMEHRQILQDAKLAKIEQFSKTTARNVMFEDRKLKDYADLGLKFKTFTQLKSAVDEKKEMLQRCMTYVDQVEFGKKFIDKFLKEVMDTSLLYRMYPADAPGKHKTLSGKLFTFGCEYHRLPEDFQEMIISYAAERWPEMWPRNKSRKKIHDLLEYHRKTRAIQMRNYLVARIKDDTHPLMRALLWDNEEKVGVFDRPAPIWGNSTEEMDSYFEEFSEVWYRKVSKLSGLARWDRQIPASFAKQKPDPNSKAERSVEAKKAEAEPHWAYS